jgi:hypothetical protein
MARMRPTTNKIQAISIAILITPVMPKRPAIMAITRKTIAKFITILLLIRLAPSFEIPAQHTIGAMIISGV